MLQIKKYVRASSIDEAYELNRKKSNVIIGGMHWLKMQTRQIQTAIDLSDLRLDKIEETEDAFEIGCMVSLRQLEQHSGLNAYSNSAVKEALKDIVGVQFRNTATIGGSICGRFGFSDVLTVFEAMETYVLCHKAGIIPLRDFASRKQDDDILIKIIVNKEPIRMAYTAQRHARTDFPMLTCAVSYIDGKWRAVVGARPGKAEMITDEKNIIKSGEYAKASEADEFGKYVAEKLTFGSNMRGSGQYRMRIAPVLVKRAVLSAGKE